MWYIVWNIESQVKHDVLGFETEAQALKYAKYYKYLLETYNDGQHMQSRFGVAEKTKAARRIHVSFQLTQKKA